LPEDPEEFCKYCQELAKSDKFTNRQLQNKIPISFEKLVFDEKGNVKYSSLLSSLKSFMNEVKEHKKVPEENTGQDQDYLKDKGSEEDKSLKEKSGKTKFLVHLVRDLTTATVLNKALECAIRVNQNLMQKKENKEELPEKYTELEKAFKTVLQKIWVLIETPDYNNCSTLSENVSRIKNMISTLREKKIPFDSKIANTHWPDDIAVNYPANLTVIKNFMDKSTDSDTIEYVKEVECAINVHQFQQQLKKGGHINLLYAQKWAKLDIEFRTAFKQIWGTEILKTVKKKTRKLRGEHILCAGDNAKAED
jgi:hypothetical protein